jgi:carbon storage regulator CsrA
VLISRRKEGEALFIGDEVEIRIISVRRNKVILGIMAPRDVKIAADKMTDMAMANTVAAVHSIRLDKLLQAPSNNREPVVVMLQPISSKKDAV